MADTKITALTAITTVDPAADVLPIVDVSDTSMAASGTTKKITSNQILGAGGTATLASATITGDLTVDTSTLKVDSANNRVGVLTASPAQALDVASGNLQVRTGGTVFSDTFSNYGAALAINAAGSLPLRLQIGGSNAYEITSGNIHTWSNVGGVAGTAMTLNSTGLGVGTASHSTRLGVVDTVNTFAATFRGNLGTDFVAIGTTALGASINAYTAGFASAAGLVLQPNGGNVGIGVTPSVPLDVRGPFNGDHAVFTGTVNRGLVIATRSDGLADSRTVIFNAAYSAGQLGQFAFQIAGTDRILMKNNGQLRFVPLASDPAGAEAGDVYYNSSSNKLKCYNGTTWNDLF